MVGLKISSDEIHEIINILGLTEEQGKIYLALLSLGTATLGQLSLLSGLDYVQTQGALQLLIGSKLVKRITGKVGRYVALEPFLKSFFLSYDPITLVNIRNESINVFKDQSKKLDDIFEASVQTFHHHAKNLEEDFSQSFLPVANNFTELIKNFRHVIETLKFQIHDNIEKLQSTIDSILNIFGKLNDEVRSEFFAKIEKIPNLFQNQISLIRQELSEICQNSSSELFQYKNSYKFDLESFKNKINDELNNNMRKVNIFLDEFEDNRSEDKRNFDDTISKTKLSLEKIRLNVEHKKSNFQIIRSGYKEIDEAIKELLGDFNNNIIRLKSIASDSILDIENRKVFRGKDEFIGKLSQIETYAKEINELIEEKKGILDNLSGLNNTFNKTENEIVEAVDIGLQNVITVLDEEAKLLSGDIESIKDNIGTTERKLIKNHFEEIKNTFNAKINAIDDELDQKIDEFNQQRDNNVTITLDSLLNLIQQITNEFKTNLEANFNEKVSFSNEKDGFSDIKTLIDDLSSLANRNLKKMLEKVFDIEISFNNYLIGLNSFTSGFADTQLNTFVSTLNKGKQIINSQVNQIENQLEQEVSALVFTIKEMQQKLNRIADLSRLMEISEIEPSLLTSDLVVGESVIIMLLRDLTIRTKSSLTILMPRPELQTLIAASKLPMKVRVNIIGDFEKVPRSTLKRVLSTNNVRLKQLDNINFWGCIRDSEELLVCPEPKDPSKEDLIGILTSNENLVELFSKELITYTTKSREILLPDFT